MLFGQNLKGCTPILGFIAFVKNLPGGVISHPLNPLPPQPPSTPLCASVIVAMIFKT
jgi:hypothetical protein